MPSSTLNVGRGPGDKPEAAAAREAALAAAAPCAASEHRVGAVAAASERKVCGHMCSPAADCPLCCACADARPLLEAYPSYVDGAGWLDDALRDAHYCPVCNPRAGEMRRQHALREAAGRAAAQADRDAADALHLKTKEADRQRAQVCGSAGAAFVYADGDAYRGDWLDGLQHGFGRLNYADGAVYEGGWFRGEHDGTGTKTWIDGIRYAGDWRRGVMHGQGRYTMADGYVMDGAFEDDEFAGALT
ncbi:hypothetical protein M885DRAFT_547731 [Pelagophyceae sp. CCMP2097]|nr:hypothetical protein M885DRAFT_547731 [Pelagophyceae sp. CCMP2097]